MGVILYRIVCGKFPFEDRDLSRLMDKALLLEPDYPFSLSEDLRNLLESLLEKDPNKRIAFERILQHVWVLKHSSKCTQPVSGALVQQFIETSRKRRERRERMSLNRNENTQNQNEHLDPVVAKLCATGKFRPLTRVKSTESFTLKARVHENSILTGNL